MIEKLPKPAPEEEDTNKPAEEKQPLESKVINSGHMPSKDAPAVKEQAPVRTHQKSRKSHKSKKHHHHVHHA